MDDTIDNSDDGTTTDSADQADQIVTSFFGSAAAIGTQALANAVPQPPPVVAQVNVNPPKPAFPIPTTWLIIGALGLGAILLLKK